MIPHSPGICPNPVDGADHAALHRNTRQQKATEQATDDHQHGKNASKPCPSGGQRHQANIQSSSRHGEPSSITWSQSHQETAATHSTTPSRHSFHDPGNSDLLKHKKKKKRKPICLNPETIKTAPLRHPESPPKPQQATKPVSAQGPRSGKATVAQTRRPGGGSEKTGRGVPSRRAPRPEALISFHLSTLQQIPRRVPGPCGAFAAGGGEDGGRRTAR